MQQAIFRSNHGTVNIINKDRGRLPLPPNESKDEILKARFEPTTAESIKAFCRGRRITVTDYIRELAKIGPDYFDHVETLNKKEVQGIVLPLLEVLSKKF